MTQTFSYLFEEEGVEYVWSVPKLHKKFEMVSPVKWEIPSDFLEKWTWGDDHLSDHLVRCRLADLSYPILVWDNIIVDGCHRVCKALAEGQTFISAIIIENMPPPCSDHVVSPTDYAPIKKWCFGDMVKIISVLD